MDGGGGDGDERGIGDAGRVEAEEDWAAAIVVEAAGEQQTMQEATK